MIKYKTKEEIVQMKEGGKKLREVVKELLAKIEIGMTTEHIDTEAKKLIRSMGGEPSFKKVKGYFWSTCLPVNEQIVHTAPSGRVLKEGDILTVDVGMYYKGFHTDFADTIAIGKISEETTRFLETGKKTLEQAIKKLKIGSRLGEISQTIEEEIEGAGYSIVKELTGHGIGRELHEDPNIPGFLDQPVNKTPMIRAGLTVAIEVIYAMGSGVMVHEPNDDWSIRTEDKSLSACFEHTLAVTDINTIILT